MIKRLLPACRGINRAIAPACVLLVLSAPIGSAQSTWSGGAGADNSLSANANWASGTSPDFGGAEASTNTNSLVFDNAVNATVNLGTSTRRGISNITFVGPNVGAFNFTNTGRWVLSYGGKISMDSAVTNSIQLGRLGFGTNSVVGGSYTLENNAALSSATLNGNISFTTANSNNISTLILDGSNTGTNIFTGASGNVAIVKNGSGRWQLSSMTTTGGFTMNSGTLALAGNNAFGGGLVTINGGIVSSVTSGRSVSNNIAIAGDFQLGGLGQSTTFSGNWDLGGGTRAITMGNSATMSGTISNGTLAIKDGTLTLSTTGLIQSNVVFSLVGTNSAATLSISGITASDLTVNNFSATTNTSITLGAKSLTVGGDNSSTTNRAAITGTGSLIKNGTGTVTLGSSTSTYSGGTSLNGGAIAIASDNAFGTGAVTIANGTQIGSYSTAQRTISNAVTVNGNFTLGGLGNNTTLNGSVNLGASDRTVTLGNSATIGGVVSGAGGLIVESSSSTRSLDLTNANTYTGPTTVNGGIFRLNGTLASSSVTINTGATLGGSGVISNATVINGIHSPGNSPGLQSFGSDLTYNNGASVTWELAADTTSGRGTSYDGINVAGILDFNGTVSLNLVFNAAGSTVDWNDILWSSDQTWTLYSVTGTTTDFASLQIVAANWADGSGNLFNTVRGPSGSSFTLVQSGQDILINYQAVPEPSTYALLGMSAAALAGYSIRRRKRAKA